MTRELLILRHGKSDWGASTDDFHRPINDRGKRSAQRIGVWLHGQGLRPDYIVSSPAERAITSAEKACKAMAMDARCIVTDRRLYMADLEALLAVLQDCPAGAKRLMMVGHNPGLEELLQYLVGDVIERAEDGKLLPTATLARLQLQDGAETTAGNAQLLSLTRPKSLPKKFPFPQPAGGEWRDRPAYYYSQSSVIPYRIGDRGVEILVIASSKKKHPVVPKGIQEPGLSAQDSAAKEALEEAGIEGEVAEQELGRYSYNKWGAECTVKVYPMRVTRELPEAEWPESHRGRQWMSPAQAAAHLREQQLLPLLQRLVKQLTDTA